MRRSLTLRRSLAALALPLLLGGLAACGSDDESADPAASSSSATESQDSSDTQSGSEVDKAEFIDDLQAGLKASTTAKMTMHMDMGGQAIHANGAVDYTTTPSQMAMTMESPAMADQAIELRLVDEVLYMNMGQLTNNKFVKYDLGDPNNLPPGMDQLTSTMNPLAAFDSFGDGIQSVVFVGDEDVDGEQLGRYEVKVDPAKIKQFEGQTQTQLPETVAYELWLDDQNRVRRMTMDMDAGSAPVKLEIELSDWGKPVDIAAPPASDIVEQPTG